MRLTCRILELQQKLKALEARLDWEAVEREKIEAKIKEIEALIEKLGL